MRSIQLGDLSTTEPIMNFTPLFLLFTSPLLVNEYPTRTGLIGVLLVVVGAYVLNIREMSIRKIFEPLANIFTIKSSRLMLMVAFTASITTAVDKIGVGNSSGLFWAFSVNLFLTFAFLTLILWKRRRLVGGFRMRPSRYMFWAGFFNGLSTVCQMTALQLTLVSYVISVKRTSAIFSVLFGFLFFNEKHIEKRVLGVVIMILGSLLITFSK